MVGPSGCGVEASEWGPQITHILGRHSDPQQCNWISCTRKCGDRCSWVKACSLLERDRCAWSCCLPPPLLMRTPAGPSLLAPSVAVSSQGTVSSYMSSPPAVSKAQLLTVSSMSPRHGKHKSTELRTTHLREEDWLGVGLFWAAGTTRFGHQSLGKKKRKWALVQGTVLNGVNTRGHSILSNHPSR